MLKGNTTSTRASRTWLFCFPGLQIPRIHNQRAPGCLPQDYWCCTGRVSAEAAGDVQFRIPTTNALLGSVPVHQLCSQPPLGWMQLRGRSLKLLIHFIREPCSNPLGELCSHSPARDQGCSPVPLSRSGSAGAPGSSQYSTSDTHSAVLGGSICTSFCSSQLGSHLLSLSHGQALLCQAVGALCNIPAARSHPPAAHPPERCRGRR